MAPKKSERGFTLIEIAIAMTIIALLIGGVLAGQSMVRNAQMRAVAAEMNRFTQAVGDFHDKYLALPGDFNGATALWGAANGVPATCYVTASLDTKTCDGDGDGRISNQTGAATNANQYEQFRAWQHLSNAHMLDGQFNGVASAVSVKGTTPGTNVPASALSGAGWNMTSLTLTESTTSPHYFVFNYRNMVQLGSNAMATGQPLAPIMSGADALSLDTKLDDGLPGSGKIMGPEFNGPYAPNCTTTNDPATSRYDVSESSYKCSLLFLLGY